ncbi:MAG: hypothetical protein JW841_07235 [Deltaproteobacteria bacterium]|nr:hypothetical protein [Deltaproteobacteria bacterium]
MNETAQTLNQLVTFLTEERRNRDDAIKDILIFNHPAFRRLADLTQTEYRIFFTNLDELSIWLKNAKGYYEDCNTNTSYRWCRLDKGWQSIISVDKGLFDQNGKLQSMTPEEWDQSLIILEKEQTDDEDAHF